MKFRNMKNKFKASLATVAVTALSAPVWAEGTPLDAAQTEIGNLKTGIVALGGVIIGIAVAIVVIGVIKRAVSKA